MTKEEILEQLEEINELIRESSNYIDEANRKNEKLIKNLKKEKLNNE